MMRKLLAVLAACLCVAALAAGLVGCSSSADPKANFLGTWKVVNMTDDNADGENTTSTIELLNSLGMEMKLSLNEDGSCSLDMAALGETESIKGTWEAKDATTCTISFEDSDPSEATLADDKLTFEQDGSKMVCEREAASE